ncbi:hypothetical protein REPUB_Repub09cG0074100 [Reevesia pubescens]
MNEKELNDMQKMIKKLLGDKNEIEKVKVSRENKNIELHKEVISHFRDSFDQVTLERDNALKGLDEEKQNGVNLRLQVSEMEKMLEKTAEELT